MTRSDPRYAGDDIDWPALQVARADVAQRFAVLFHDRPYQDAGGALIVERETNRMPTLETSPRDSPAWCRRVEKARREIAEHQAHIEWQSKVTEVHRRWSSDDVAGLVDLIEGAY